MGVNNNKFLNSNYNLLTRQKLNPFSNSNSISNNNNKCINSSNNNKINNKLLFRTKLILLIN